MREWIEQGFNKEHKQRYEAIVYLAECFKRILKIYSHTSAEYWIDNRFNQSENYMNQKLLREARGLD